MNKPICCSSTQGKGKLESKVTKLTKNLGCLILLLILCRSTKSVTCPSNVTSTSNATTQLNTFSGYSNVIAYNVEIGPVSSALYFMYSLTSSSITAFLKLNSDGTEAWSKSVSLKIPYKSLAVDNSEICVYFIKIDSSNPMIVGRLKASDGTLADAQSHNSFYNDYLEDTKLHVLSDNSGYYVIQMYNDLTPHILKYSFLSSSNQQFILNNIYWLAYGTLKLSDTEFFLITRTTSTHNAVFMKLTFANTSANWAKQMSCSISDCLISFSSSLLSIDRSKIYTIFSYQQTSNWNVYFSSFQTSDGAIVGNRYQSSSCSGSCVTCSVLNGDNIVSALECTSVYLVVYNIPASSFTFKLFSGILSDCEIEIGSNRLIIVGQMSATGYVARFPLDSLGLMTDFTATNSIMNIDTVSTFTSISVSLTSKTDPVTDYTSLVTVLNVTYISTITYIPDVYNQINYQSYSLIEGTSFVTTPDLTCSYSGITAIAYSIANYITQAPSWISIDQISGKLNITAPIVTADTTYSFYINSEVSGAITKKLISVTVLNCAVKSCKTCSSSASICSVCNAGYSLTTSGTCLIIPPTASESAKIQAAVNLSITGAVSCITGFLGFSNISSLGNLWSMFGQIQLLFFLLLTNAYIPFDIKAVITGSGFFLNLGALFSLDDYQFYRTFIKNFDFDVSNSDFGDFGLKSSSSLYNTISLFTIFILTVLLHIFLRLLKILLDRCGPLNSVWCCPLRLIRWIIEKVVIMLTYSIYIRFTLQAIQFCLVVCIYEIYMFKFSQIYYIISFAFAVLLLSGIFILIGVVIYLSLSSYFIYEEFHNNIGELFVGIQMGRKCKFYVALMLIRKTLFAIVLVFCMNMNCLTIIFILCFIEICYFGYLVVVRPFNQIKGNIIEITNEIFFFFFISILFYFNEERNWTSTITSIYSYTITANNIVVLIIISSKVYPLIV